MLNLLWCMMLLTGIVYGAFNGTMPEITDAALDSARQAVSLCISISGIVAFWNGLMRIAEEAGLVSAAAKKLQPFLLWMMPGLEGEIRTLEYISMNMIANVLGLGWAATPAGLKAMESLAELEEKRRRGGQAGTDLERAGEKRAAQNAQEGRRSVKGMPRGSASNEMCTFLILNISSLQLIPVNIIAYRSQYGSAAPTAIVGPGLLATAVSTGVAIVFCKALDSKGRV